MPQEPQHDRRTARSGRTAAARAVLAALVVAAVLGGSTGVAGAQLSPSRPSAGDSPFGGFSGSGLFGGSGMFGGPSFLDRLFERFGSGAGTPAPSPSPSPTPDPSPAPGQRQPVIFVQGLNGSPANFDTMSGQFRGAGYPADHLVSFGYRSTGDMTVAAEELAAEVERVRARTGADKVDIVGHSLGGLPSRWYITFLGGTETVDDWVALGSPNQGGARGTCPAPGSTACTQVTQGADWITQLNSGDQTPGDVTYTTFASPCDRIVDASWTPIEGADNRTTPCLSHFELVRDRQLAADVIAVTSG
jgi:triacylglycerol lipase